MEINVLIFSRGYVMVSTIEERYNNLKSIVGIVLVLVILLMMIGMIVSENTVS